MPADGSKSENSVTHWLQALKAERSVAGQRLWDRYVEKLARLARRKLAPGKARHADESDVVIEVYTDFLEGVKQGRFSRLNDRNDLWQILTMLTERKAIDQLRRERAAKRGEGKVRGESVLLAPGTTQSRGGLHQVPSPAPSPEFAAEFSELLRTLLNTMPNELLRLLVRDSLAGYTQQEMAERHGLSVPTIQRKLRLVRAMWQSE